MQSERVADSACDHLEGNPPPLEPESRMIGGRRTVFATPYGDPRTVIVQARADAFAGVPGAGAFPQASHVRVKTFPLHAAIAQAQAGDIVQLLPGKYWPPLHSGRGHAIHFHSSGAPGNEIVVRGMGAKTVLAGSNAATPLYPELPDADDFAFFQIHEHSHIVFENLHAESCWPCFVYVEDAHHITMRGCSVVDGVYVLFARGPGCHALLVEQNSWVQDPTGTLWDAIDFDDSHGEGDQGRYRFYNGAMFGSLDIAGSVVVRRNHIRDAYNGIRMDTTSEARGGCPRKYNYNVQIYENLFERCRDNAVEPEGHALNWHVYHNRICDCHGWFSWDGVAGGMVLIFGNVGWFTSRPGQFWDANSGGKVFKSIRSTDFKAANADDRLLPSKPIHMFNNSWFLRIFVVKKSELRQFFHYNNALVYCDARGYEPCTCKSDRQLFTGLMKERGWDAGDVSFDHDATDRPDFGPDAKAARQERHGTTGAMFGFENAAQGQFSFDGQGVPGRRVELTAGRDLPGMADWRYPSTPGGSVFCGAYQGRVLIPAPGFAPYRPRDVNMPSNEYEADWGWTC